MKIYLRVGSTMQTKMSTEEKKMMNSLDKFVSDDS